MLLLDGMIGSGIQSAQREAEYAEKVKLSGPCTTRQWTDEEKERIMTMTHKRGPKPKVQRFCPACFSTVWTKEHVISANEEITCGVCGCVSKAQLLDTIPRLLPDADPAAGTMEAEAGQATETESHTPMEEQDPMAEIHGGAESEPVHSEFDLGSKDAVMTVIDALLEGAIGEAKETGYREGYARCRDDIMAAIRALGAEFVMAGGCQ